MATRKIGVGVIGLGFMGRTHLAAFAAADAAGFGNRLVAVCDSDPARR
ncbi:MAG: gfo/Idh/MocA family oxidoreductase, partial [Planctomycetaceae bacterium]|nr:gfo/Idh/MocA family oxidoreductase [Planctomycetaceae bacterium]